MWNIFKTISFFFLFHISCIVNGEPLFYSKNPSINLGLFSANQPQEASYIISNNGNESLKISSARSTCSCATLTFPEHITPGKSGRIILSISENSYSGDFKGKIYLISNDKSSPHELVFNGHATPLFTISPSSEYYAGVISRKEKWKKTFIISSKNPSLQFGVPQTKTAFPVNMNLEKNSSGQYQFTLEFFNSGWKQERFLISVEIPVLEPEGWPPAKFQVSGRLCL